jgi:hypothetical protein
VRTFGIELADEGVGIRAASLVDERLREVDLSGFPRLRGVDYRRSLFASASAA